MQKGNDLILLDTGLGFNLEGGEMQLHHNLRQHGFEPGDITRVLLSHLHKDHAGGVTHRNAAGVFQASLPNAVYYIYRPEAEAALATGYPSYMPEELEPLFQSGQVEWLEQGSGTIGGDIHYFHSGGHSREHIVFLIEDNGDKIFFGGDEAPQLKQMKMKYVAKYDYDGKKAMQLREEYAEKGRVEQWQFLFYHDVKSPVAQL